MRLNLNHRPEGATHAGKDEHGGSWYKKNDDGHWLFIDMVEDGLPDRQWCLAPDNAPGYVPIALPEQMPTVAQKTSEDGGSAFPEPGNAQCGGMSLRDYFAASCDISQYDVAGVFHRTYGRNPDATERAALTAEIRYIEADAMLAARSA
mgnify:CR=1 FL=1